MKWLSEYRAGIHLIDEQHQVIFKTIESFIELLERGQGASDYSMLLELLRSYTKSYYCCGNTCSDSNNCPFAQKDKYMEAQMLNELDEYLNRYKATGFQLPDARELIAFLDAWFEEHMRNLRMHIRSCNIE